MKFLMIIPVFCLCLQISGSNALSSDGSADPSGCDKAVHYRVLGDFDDKNDRARRNYHKAIELCPGYIRPYEMVGNLYRKENQYDKAIEYFTKAAELGSANNKLYYLLARLLFQKGDLDAAGRNIKKSLSIRGNYPRALRLNQKIEAAADKEGPRIILYEPSTRRGMKILKTYGNLTVRGLATDRSGVTWVKINQQETSLDEHGNFLKDIPIQQGTNTIRLEAADSLGNRAQISIDIEGEKYALPPLTRIEAASQTKSLYGRSFAIVIGINDYDKWPGLEFAVADANSVKDILEKTGFDDITLIMDKVATQRRILTRKNAFFLI